MTPETVIDVIRRAIEVGGMVAGPMLLVSLIAGVGVSIVQATTQIQDMTLVFVPKILATIATLILLGSWMLQMYIDFTRQILLSLPALVG
jgi:flagellar biosynthesis protein FliQ